MKETTEATERRPGANESDWYDDFYRAAQVMGPWYYFMIPHLRRAIGPKTKLVELGCGQGHVLRYLADKAFLAQENLYAIDQSKTAVGFVKLKLPRAHLSVGDIYKLEFGDGLFDVCLLMETIEHLEEPLVALAEIWRVTKPGGLLYVSFPNFLHLPWLAVRILAEKLNHPNWIVLQPVDKIYTVFGVIRMVKKAGFSFREGIGSNYGPPVLYPLEKEWVTKCLNALGLWRLSFHPILVFEKPTAPPE